MKENECLDTLDKIDDVYTPPRLLQRSNNNGLDSSERMVVHPTNEKNFQFEDQIQEMIEALIDLKQQVEEANKVRDATLSDLQKLQEEHDELKKEAEEARDELGHLKRKNRDLEGVHKREMKRFAKVKSQVRIVHHELEEIMKLIK